MAIQRHGYSKTRLFEDEALQRNQAAVEHFAGPKPWLRFICERRELIEHSFQWPMGIWRHGFPGTLIDVVIERMELMCQLPGV